jgi:hypothetical protein
MKNLRPFTKLPAKFGLFTFASLILSAAALTCHGEDKMVPLNLKLPAAAFLGTPSDAPVGADVEKPTGKPRPPIMVPEDVKNVALNKPVTSSDQNVVADDLKKVTDGEKDAVEQNVVLLRRGPQWLQIDLGSPTEIFAIVVWHAHETPKVYHNVVVEVSDDPEFKQGVHAVFNNDKQNTLGLGTGTNREYFETNEGKLIEVPGLKARYVRLYSNGSTETRRNEYTEVEVYGRPPK